MKFNKSTLTIVAGLVFTMGLLGCDKADKVGSESDQKKTETGQAAQQDQNKMFASKGDPNVPLSQYVVVANQSQTDQRAEWLTYLAVANDKTPSTDVELMEMFSGKYYNEKDGFKKQEIMNAELGAIKERVKSFQGAKYFALDFYDYSSWFGNPNLTLQPYNFTTQTFDAKAGTDCLERSFVNQQNVQLSIKPLSNALCQIKVEDVATAKEIEGLRAKDRAKLGGRYYFYIDNVDGNRVNATVLHVSYKIYDAGFMDKPVKVVFSQDK